MTPEEKIEQAKEYLARLLKHVYPDIEPLDTLLGLISQVDNGFAVPMKQMGEQKTFKEVVKPVMEYLAKNKHPHMSIVIDATSAELLEVVEYVVTDEFVPD